MNRECPGWDGSFFRVLFKQRVLYMSVSVGSCALMILPAVLIMFSKGFLSSPVQLPYLAVMAYVGTLLYICKRISVTVLFFFFSVVVGSIAFSVPSLLLFVFFPCCIFRDVLHFNPNLTLTSSQSARLKQLISLYKHHPSLRSVE